MKISFNWLKWYIPECPSPEKLADVFTYHICEVEDAEKKDGDFIFDINILPNRAHDLLSHQGIAKEISSLLDIKYVDPTPKYKIPESKPTELKIEIKTDKCRRYIGRIVRNVKVGPSPDWVKAHLESIGQRSINNIVDAANIVMFDCGQPCHIFDLDKLSSEKIIIRQAKEGENITILDGKEIKLSAADMVIADEKNALAIAGIKGGKIAEVDDNTKNIMIEMANFNPVSVRKTGRKIGIFTDAVKRFENDLSPELCEFAMLEISGLLAEYGFKEYEDIVDVYPQKQKENKLSFSADKISKILGLDVSVSDIENILKRYNFRFTEKKGSFEINVPSMRLDLVLEEDMAEEIGRILGYDKVKGKIPKINFKPEVNETYAKISWARNKLLNDGYSEVMTYTFCDKGEVEVLASASDKKFLRTNLSDGLKESLKLNQLNAPLFDADEIKIFEIGTVFKKDKEEMHVAYGDKKEIKEMNLEDYTKSAEPFLNGLAGVGDPENRGPEKMALPMKLLKEQKFKMWSLFPFIARDIAVWVPENVSSAEVEKVIKNSAGELVTKGPELFDEFKKDGKISYAFKLVFQSPERTLKDTEINEIMTKITNKIKEKNGWQVR